jgi:hypothetical protein
MPIHTTKDRVVTAMFENLNQARRTAQDLRQGGVPDDDISLLSSAKHYSEDDYRKIDRAYVNDELTATGAGAGTGAAVGGVGGFIIGLSSIALPGIGPVLAVGNLLAATLAGIAAGGVTGGLIGALVDLGIPKERARLYDLGIREGYVLVATRASSPDVSDITDIYAKHGPIKIRERIEV